MTSEREDVNKELERRRALRKKRQAQREKAERERRALFLRLGAAGLVILAVALVIIGFTRNDPAPAETTPPQTSQPAQTRPTTPSLGESQEPQAGQNLTTIHIAAAGDLNVTDQMVASALTMYGYDFTSAFLDVAPVLSQADLTVLNYEGTFGGDGYGTETGSAPFQLAQAMAAMGVDAVQTANSASIRSGVLGLQSTIQTLNTVGIQAVGTFADSSAFRSSGGYTIMEVQGLRIALVGFTKGMDNLGLPEGSRDCVNLLYTDYTTTYDEIDTNSIRRVLRNVAEEQPDLTIAMLHWGSEYNEGISSSQKKIRNLMLENGVDIILGTHSHLLKGVEHDTANNTLVAWSLGDFYGDGSQPGSNYSIVLDIEVTRDNVTGEVTISGYSYTPIYILQPGDSLAGGQRVVRINAAMARYEGNYLGKITGGVYSSMEYALKRIDQRTAEKVG
ncbi:MAG: CapA family protein [Oscillospiraceae bacterium]|nr:CapA family protein [Oscillospiraceae bacterium]